MFHVFSRYKSGKTSQLLQRGMQTRDFLLNVRITRITCLTTYKTNYNTSIFRHLEVSYSTAHEKLSEICSYANDFLLYVHMRDSQTQILKKFEIVDLTDLNVRLL